MEWLVMLHGYMHVMEFERRRKKPVVEEMELVEELKNNA
ncbi:hypothetical protein PAP_04090 [Palaeococcus pacificus DY20341]|uniref:Uncharacterized protein n=1 Tax=Palaeococcus pacificus DY20341 TaxID=1343739 RepID=A0A075LSH5_9EURY|nr:hypothetical protein PAP_04090 [Palaeococcus pacificus DY20341]